MLTETTGIGIACAVEMRGTAPPSPRHAPCHSARSSGGSDARQASASGTSQTPRTASSIDSHGLSTRAAGSCRGSCRRRQSAGQRPRVALPRRRLERLHIPKMGPSKCSSSSTPSGHAPKAATRRENPTKVAPCRESHREVRYPHELDSSEFRADVGSSLVGTPQVGGIAEHARKLPCPPALAWTDRRPMVKEAPAARYAAAASSSSALSVSASTGGGPSTGPASAPLSSNAAAGSAVS